MDILITLALVYLAYRGYNWYAAIQARIKDSDIREVDEEVFIKPNPEPGKDDDYIDYEEVN